MTGMPTHFKDAEGNPVNFGYVWERNG